MWDFLSRYSCIFKICHRDMYLSTFKRKTLNEIHTSLAVLAIQNLCRQCHPVPLLLDADFLPNTGDSWASGKGDRTASTVQRHCIPKNGTCLKNYYR